MSSTTASRGELFLSVGLQHAQHIGGNGCWQSQSCLEALMTMGALWDAALQASLKSPRLSWSTVIAVTPWSWGCINGGWAEPQHKRNARMKIIKPVWLHCSYFFFCSKRKQEEQVGRERRCSRFFAPILDDCRGWKPWPHSWSAMS